MNPASPPPPALQPVLDALRAAARACPTAWEDTPWGDLVTKTGSGKIFVFWSSGVDHIGLSVKLAASHAATSARPGVTPTGYGLGRSGWLSLRLTAPDAIPVDALIALLHESFRLVAPKRVGALLPPR